MRAGPWETVLKPPYRHLVEPEAPHSVTAQSGYNRSSPYLWPLQESARGAPLDSLPVLLWFELPDFALEIIDAGLCIRQLTIVIFHFLAELLMLELHIVQLHILLRSSALRRWTQGRSHSSRSSPSVLSILCSSASSSSRKALLERMHFARLLHEFLSFLRPLLGCKY